MRLRSLTRRRPSAAIVISSVALFLSLGGVGAAYSGLIGTSQIANNAVTYSKIAPGSVGRVRLADGGVINSKLANNSVAYNNIQPGSVGTRRANLNQLQARVSGTCPSGQAVATVANNGAVTCNATLPAEYGTTSNTATLTPTAATVSTVTLPTGGTYLGLANTSLSATSGSAAAHVTVSCTLTVGSNTLVRTAMLHTDGNAGDVATGSLPLSLAGSGGPATVACTATVASGETLPTVTATSSINALATASNN